MSRINSVLGYLWALLAFPIVLATFIGNNFWAEKLINVTGFQISPWHVGGEVVQTIDHGRYQTLLRRPVFDGLIAERRKGFVQIDWEVADGSLPERIDDDIDYDQDGTKDFRIQLDTGRNKAEVIPLTPYVNGVEGVYNLENGRAVRVLLKNKRNYFGI